MKPRSDFTFVRIATENVVICLWSLCKSLALFFLNVYSLDLRKAVAAFCGTAVREFGEVIHWPDWAPFQRFQAKKWNGVRSI